MFDLSFFGRSERTSEALSLGKMVMSSLLQFGGEGMELVDVVIVAVIFGIFNVILYVAAISLLREHEKMINEKMKSRRHT